MIEIPNTLKQYQQKKLDYEELADRVEQIMFEILNIEKINYALTDSRVKSIESFQTKMKNSDKNKELYDLAGIRVVGYVKSDVEKIVKVIHDNFIVDENKSRDKSSDLRLDQFGYRAIHLICTLPNTRTILPEYAKFKEMYFEIQVKTILEHAWAQIEHDRNYKYKGLPDDIKHDFYLAAGILETADNQFESINKRIEKYDKSIKQKTSQGKLNEISLNPMSLKQFLKDKFQNEINPTYGFKGNGEIEMEELNYFEINNIEQLNEIIPDNLLKIMSNVESNDQRNLTYVLFAILLIHFGKKYWGIIRKTRKVSSSLFKKVLADFQKTQKNVSK